jgi:diguanylate cyclase (GGDEF)-like protein
MKIPLQPTPAPPGNLSGKENISELESKLHKLERRDWWLWSMAVIVMMLLTFAVFSLSFPDLIKVDDPFFQASLTRAVRGLIGLVLLFNAYTIYQQVMVKKLRSQFSQQLAEMRVLHIRAENFQKLAMHDPLTGLSNRRLAEERLSAEASRSCRYGHPLTVVSFDLDNFKHINDTYGHPVGDLVLKEFARRLNSAVRLSDFASRMGGDEFLVLLPDCPTAHVDHLLSRLRPMAVEYDHHTIPIEFSAGWVGYEKGETTEEFLARADRTLYSEKRAGKSRVKETTAVH